MGITSIPTTLPDDAADTFDRLMKSCELLRAPLPHSPPAAVPAATHQSVIGCYTSSGRYEPARWRDPHDRARLAPEP